MTDKTVSVADFLTTDQIKQAIRIYNGREHPSTVVDRFEAEIIKPNMDEINRKLGQENDSRYLAYAVAYALTTYGGR